MLAKMSFLWTDKTCQKDDNSKDNNSKNRPKPSDDVTHVSEHTDDVIVVSEEPKDDDDEEDVIKESPKTSTPKDDRVAKNVTKDQKHTEILHTETKTDLKADTKSSTTAEKEIESEKLVETKKIEKSSDDGETSSTSSSRSEKSKLENVEEKSSTDKKEAESSLTSTTENVEKLTKVDDKKSTKKIPTDHKTASKKATETGTAFKRKLEEEKSANETDSSKDDHEESVAKSKAFGKVKKIKRSHTSEAVSKLKTANAISSSLSSSLLEKEEQSRVGKRKLRSPEQGINERKFPKKESEKLQQLPKNLLESLGSGEESDENESVNILPEAETRVTVDDDSFPSDGHPDEVDFSHVSEKSNIAESFIDNSFLDETGTTILIASETEESPYAKIPVIEEIDRRHEIADVEALDHDRERDRARAEKLLSAFDDSD